MTDATIRRREQFREVELIVTPLSAFYELLTRKVLWIRWDGAEENGYSAFYLPSLAILRKWPADVGRGRCVENLLSHAAQLYGVETRALAEMPSEEQQIPAIATRILRRNPEITTVLFEGYAHAPAQEGADAHGSLEKELFGSGCEILLSDLAAARAWISKAAFYERVASYYGLDAALPGVTLRDPSIGEVLVVVGKWLEHAGRVIVKRNGSGGEGNLVIQAGADLLGSRLESFLSAAYEPTADWVRVESWLDWDSTYCCSFFLRASGEPLHVALAQQVISGDHAAFIGSRDMLDLDERDQEAVIDLTKPLARLMQLDGIRGFSAVDLIVSRIRGWEDGLRLPSGRALRFVECNPRINGHNQILIAVNRLAARGGYRPGDLAYLSVKMRPFVVAGELQEMQNVLDRSLDGMAKPLTDERLRGGSISYLIAPKVQISSIYASDVVFVGLRRWSPLQQMLAAAEALRRAGLVTI